MRGYGRPMQTPMLSKHYHAVASLVLSYELVYLLRFESSLHLSMHLGLGTTQASTEQCRQLLR
jgi:hypothetical protein